MADLIDERRYLAEKRKLVEICSGLAERDGIIVHSSHHQAYTIDGSSAMYNSHEGPFLIHNKERCLLAQVEIKHSITKLVVIPTSVNLSLYKNNWPNAQKMEGFMTSMGSHYSTDFQDGFSSDLPLEIYIVEEFLVR